MRHIVNLLLVAELGRGELGEEAPDAICMYGYACRCREKQRKEATRLVSVNAKLTALNKLLMEENERLAKHTSQLTVDNHFLRKQLQQLPPIPGSKRPPDQVCMTLYCNSRVQN
jgi:homeobox-leucine zipper protein